MTALFLSATRTRPLKKIKRRERVVGARVDRSSLPTLKFECASTTSALA